MLAVDSDTWRLRKRSFPDAGSVEEKLRFLVDYAILAPSSHNSQPWLFWIHRGEMDLYADRSRALPVVDPEDRELTISCGCALHHYRLAMQRFGMTPITTLLPDSENPDHLARVAAGATREPTCDDRRMFRAMRRRRTVRTRYQAREVPADVVAALQYAAASEGAWLEVLGADRRDRIVELAMEGDRVQGSDASFRRELHSWLHPHRTRSGNGMPGYAVGWSGPMAYVGPLVVRTFDWGESRAARDRELAEGSPLLLVLGTPDDGAASWLRAGQALSRVLLLAAAEQLAASYLNQPVEVAHLRAELATLLGRGGVPQLVLRMGYGPDVEPTPRRSVADVMVA